MGRRSSLIRGRERGRFVPRARSSLAAVSAVPLLALAAAMPTLAVAAAHGKHGHGKPTSAKHVDGEQNVEASIVLALTPPEESLPQTSRIVLSVPERFRDAGASLPQCSVAVIVSKGTSSCPKGSQIGGGVATGYTILGGQFVIEHLSVTLLNGPGGELLSWVEGRTPVAIEEVVEGLISKPAGYGEQMSFTIPHGLLEPLPGAPGWLQRLEAHIDASSGWLRSKSCPPHPWSLKAELGYTNGQGTEIAAKLKCA